ncbi:MAG: WbuC family cupin fold metalloprotein [Leptospiraceae bacterium]|nr:WbuC family cupin fold metalloprotein [Leptospiraceae bacterium]
MEGLQWITPQLMQDTLEKARVSPRRRTNFNFHESMEENPHRFLNVMLRGTYIQPHQHMRPPKAESFLILDGSVAFLIFSQNGELEDAGLLGADLSGDSVFCRNYGLNGVHARARGVDIVPGLWHTLVVLSDHAVCYEVKPGPYRPADDKEFASWAPAEGDTGVSDFLNSLEDQLAERWKRSR